MVYRSDCRYLPYSIHFSKFMPIFFTRKRTKHEFPLHGVWNSRFSSFNQNSSNKTTRTYDSPISTRICRQCELLANCGFALHGVRTRDFQHSIRTAATRRRQLTTRQSPLVSAVRANCKFALRGRDSFR